MELLGCAQGAHAGAATASGAQAPWSDTNKDLVRRQVEDHLAIDPSTAGLKDFAVKIDLIMNPDGSVRPLRSGHLPTMAIRTGNSLRRIVCGQFSGAARSRCRPISRMSFGEQ